jgi:alkylation response protein AidB-like acyl-CoA dehydrogenase
MAELGWQGIIVPEEYGGLGMGQLELACVLEECGRNLVPEPLLSTVLLGANALLLAGSDEQKRELLPRIVDGSLLLALAYHERRARYDVCRVRTTARRRGSGWVLSGEKTLVFDGHVAERLVVSARTSGDEADRDGISLFLVDAGSAGLEVVRQSTVDLRNAASVRLQDVDVPDSALLATEGTAGPLLADVVDRATVGLCAEMLGSASAAFEMTLDYLKTRKQFGVLIGTFQALKHRAALMFVELELARSAVAGACDALARGADNARELVSVAKARCSDTAVLVGNEAIQMHGGIGMTDEHDVGFYAKRARAAELTFGDAAHHRARFAELRGY